jgi:hypothetical protein
VHWPAPNHARVQAPLFFLLPSPVARRMESSLGQLDRCFSILLTVSGAASVVVKIQSNLESDRTMEDEMA